MCLETNSEPEFAAVMCPVNFPVMSGNPPNWPALLATFLAVKMLRHFAEMARRLATGMSWSDGLTGETLGHWELSKEVA